MDRGKYIFVEVRGQSWVFFTITLHFETVSHQTQCSQTDSIGFGLQNPPISAPQYLGAWQSELRSLLQLLLLHLILLPPPLENANGSEERVPGMAPLPICLPTKDSSLTRVS